MCTKYILFYQNRLSLVLSSLNFAVTFPCRCGMSLKHSHVFTDLYRVKSINVSLNILFRYWWWWCAMSLKHLHRLKVKNRLLVATTRTFSPRGDTFIHNLQFRKDKRKVSDKLPQTRPRLFCSLWGCSLRWAFCVCGLLIWRWLK